MGLVATVALWILGILLGLYVLFAEFLDTIGRLEIIEKRWPAVWRIMSNRPFRLALLLFLVVLLAKDVSERWHENAPSCLTVVMPAPAAPIVQFVSPSKTQARKEASAPIVDVKQEGGNGNKANPGTTAAPVHVEPCGVFQNGGSNNNASPNCGPPERHLTDKQKKAISDALKGKQIVVHVGYMVNVPDALDYANELCDAIKEGIPATNCSDVWAMVQEKRGAPWVGFSFDYKGDSVPQGEALSISLDSPVGILKAQATLIQQ
jgi:hypothetical protein